MDDQSQWPTWRDALSVAGTVAAAYFGYLLALAKDRKVKQDEIDRHARYAAIRVVCELDRFVSACDEVACDEGLPDEQGFLEPRVALPSLAMPTDIDWKSVVPDLMYRTLTLPNEIIHSNQCIEFVADYVSGPPDYSEVFDERIVQYAELGLKALALADDFRKTYGIPKSDLDSLALKERLQTKLSAAQERRRAIEAQQARFWSERAEPEGEPNCDKSDLEKGGPLVAAARELGIDKDDAHRAGKVASLSNEAKQAARKTGLDDNC